MARRADIFLHPKRQRIWCAVAITRYLLDNGLAHDDFLRQWVNGLDEYKKTLAPFTMEFASQTCGFPGNARESRTHDCGSHGVCILWAME